MILEVKAHAKKGAMYAVLKSETEALIERLASSLSDGEVELLRTAASATNKLIHQVPAGRHVDVLLIYQDAPFQSGSISLQLDFSGPKYSKKEGAN